MEHRAGLCPRFHQAIEFVGKRWSGAILMLLMGRESARFNELISLIPGISDRLLSERLREFEDAGVVERTVIGVRPVLVLYKLTERGRALEPAITELARWADTWIERDDVQAKGMEMVASGAGAEQTA